MRRRLMEPGWNPDRDPLMKYRRPLIAVLIAVVVSLFIAAFIGGAMPLEYSGRAWTYTVLVLYVLVGAVLVFRRIADGERHVLTPGRMLKWIVSLWLWPVLLWFLRRD